MASFAVDDFDSSVRSRLVDDCIKKLISVIHQPPGTEVNLKIDRIVTICKEAAGVFMTQPMLLEIPSPVIICGDTHGQYSDLLRLFELGGFPPSSTYLFLGDYVDRAKQSIETMVLLLCYKIKYPTSVFLLRGNHECSSLNRIYGFFDECKRRYNVKLWRCFSDTFNCMPVAAIVENKIFCMHGGLSPDLNSLSQIFAIPRPSEIPDKGLFCDLVWSDPDDNTAGWSSSSRGVSYTFGRDVIRQFLQKNNLELICRGHQVVEDGYEFQCDRQLVTVFSAPNYCGEFDNAGAVMFVSEDLVCSFKILRPISHKANFPDLFPDFDPTQPDTSEPDIHEIQKQIQVDHVGIPPAASVDEDYLGDSLHGSSTIDDSFHGSVDDVEPQIGEQQSGFATANGL